MIPKVFFQTEFNSDVLQNAHSTPNLDVNSAKTWLSNSACILIFMQATSDTPISS